MADLSEFEAVQSRLRVSGYPSWYEKVVAQITPDQREALDAALMSDHLTARAIAVVIEGWTGLKVSIQSIGTRRRLLRG